MNTKLAEFVVNLTKEYIENKGNITIEFSSSTEEVTSLQRIFEEADIDLLDYSANWVNYQCDTCKGYDKNKPIHCEIIKNKTSGEIK